MLLFWNVLGLPLVLVQMLLVERWWGRVQVVASCRECRVFCRLIMSKISVP